MPSIDNAYRWAIQTCNAPNVGYSQSYRNAETSSAQYGFPVTFYDCSSFIWYALKAGGFDVVGANGGETWPFTTWSMTDVLLNLGFREVPLNGTWVEGDILLTISGEHTEMVYRGGVGQGMKMGAHTNNAPLEYQVSIGTASGNPDYISTASEWEHLFRYNAGASGNWQWYIGGNYEDMSDANMINNAHCIAGYFLAKGWTVNAIAGLLGNIQQECQINPAGLEAGVPYPLDGKGMGLVQWTPAGNRYTEPNPLRVLFNALGYADFDNTWTDPEKQLNCLYAEYEEATGLAHRGIEKQWYEGFSSVPPEYKMSWLEYSQSFRPADELACVFMYCYERAGTPMLENRKRYALAWYDIIKNDSPYFPPQIPITEKHKMPLWMMLRYR